MRRWSWSVTVVANTISLFRLRREFFSGDSTNFMSNSIPYFGFSTSFLMVIFQTIYPTLFKYLLSSMPAALRPAVGGEDASYSATRLGVDRRRQLGDEPCCRRAAIRQLVVPPRHSAGGRIGTIRRLAGERTICGGRAKRTLARKPPDRLGGPSGPGVRSSSRPLGSTAIEPRAVVARPAFWPAVTAAAAAERPRPDDADLACWLAVL